MQAAQEAQRIPWNTSSYQGPPEEFSQWQAKVATYGPMAPWRQELPKGEVWRKGWNRDQGYGKGWTQSEARSSWEDANKGTSGKNQGKGKNKGKKH